MGQFYLTILIASLVGVHISLLIMEDKHEQIATALCWSSLQSALAGYLDSYQADKISDHVYVIHGPTELPNETNEGFMNNPAFVLTE